MTHFDITGMSCAACSARVEKAVSALNSVDSCSVNLLTNSMTVSGSFTNQEIIDAVNKAGYGANVKGENAPKKSDKPKENILSRLLFSLFFLVILMYISMGHLMWNFPLPRYFSENPLKIALLEALLSSIILIINKRFFISGFKALINRSPNMDTLVSLGSFSAFCFSIAELFTMSDAIFNGDINLANHYLHSLYFESAAMILTLITLGKMLEAHSKGKTTDAIKSLIKMTPKTAIILKDGEEITVPADSLKVGDIFIVKPAQSIPCDGVVTEGIASIDESILTGESMPRDVKENDTVSGATINKSGYIKCRATRVGKDTAFAEIIKMVENASASKPPIQKVADKVSGVFVPIVILLSVITLSVWLILGFPLGIAIRRAVSVLVVSCPCALGLATPVAIMVAAGVGAKMGILFKNSTALENTGRAKIVALDKTGTITKGEPSVTDLVPTDVSSEYLLKIAYSLEVKSEHPLAYAIVKKAKEENTGLFETENFRNDIPGGVSSEINGKVITGGKAEFTTQYAEIPEDILNKTLKEAKKGKTPIYFTEDGKLLGYILIRDEIRDDSILAIKELLKLGIDVVMLTGDNEDTAAEVAKIVGIEKVYSSILPGDKEKIVNSLKKDGKVIMVGDGINDAPALTSADIGIAIGRGTDVAIESADIVLTGSKLSDVAEAIKLSRKTLKNIYENLFWAFFYNTIGIPLAAGVFIPVFNLDFGPMFAAAAMSLSSFFVVSNALRLNLFNKQKEKKKMEITLNIEGMMCPHCEARVKKCLEETAGVTEAQVSHEKGTAKVRADDTITKETLKKIIEEQGYKVL